MDPPKIGDGVFGSNFGAVHGASIARTTNDRFCLDALVLVDDLFVNCALELFFEDNFGEDFIANATDEVTEAILSCGWRSRGSLCRRKRRTRVCLL